MVAGPALRTFADEPEKPLAHRMELILKSVKVLDDSEPALELSGEMRLNARFWPFPRCSASVSEPKARALDLVTDDVHVTVEPSQCDVIHKRRGKELEHHA
jgi:hypothetical protein